MRAFIGIAILISGIAALIWARPRNGKARAFVDTQLEVPIVLAILGIMTVGTVMFISGLIPEKG